jgi:hypothetical protein
MTDLDAATRMEMTMAAAREWCDQLSVQLVSKGWAVRLAAMDCGPLRDRSVPILRAQLRFGRALVVLDRKGEVVTLIQRMREVVDDARQPTGETAATREVQDWLIRSSSTTPPSVVAAVAELAAHDPDDLRICP